MEWLRGLTFVGDGESAAVVPARDVTLELDEERIGPVHELNGVQGGPVEQRQRVHVVARHELLLGLLRHSLCCERIVKSE